MPRVALDALAGPEKLGSPFAKLASLKGRVPTRAERAAIERRARAKAKKKKALEDAAGAEAARKEKAKPTPGPRPRADERPIGDRLERYGVADRKAFRDAFADVRPLGATAAGSKPKRRPPSRKAVTPLGPDPETLFRERQARETLDRLVGGGVRLHLRRNADGGVEGWRDGAQTRTLRLLSSGTLAPEARIDLHGLRRAEVAAKVSRFVRDSHRKGRRTVALIHGKGRHSEGGRGVLEGACVEALSEGGAAPLVEAFTTAPERHGGHGVLVVRLRDRL